MIPLDDKATETDVLSPCKRLSNLAGSVIFCDEPRQIVRSSHAVVKSKFLPSKIKETEKLFNATELA